MTLNLEQIDTLVHPPYTQIHGDEAATTFMPLATPHITASMRAAKILGTETSTFMQTGMFRTRQSTREVDPDLPETYALQQYERRRKNAHGSIVAWASRAGSENAITLSQSIGIGKPQEKIPNARIHVVLQYDQNEQISPPVMAGIRLRIGRDMLQAIWMKHHQISVSPQPRSKAMQDIHSRLQSDALPRYAHALMQGMFALFNPQIRASYASTETLTNAIQNILKNSSE